MEKEEPSKTDATRSMKTKMDETDTGYIQSILMLIKLPLATYNLHYEYKNTMLVNVSLCFRWSAWGGVYILHELEDQARRRPDLVRIQCCKCGLYEHIRGMHATV